MYTQHSPRLEQTIAALAKGRLKEQTHPFVEGGGVTREKPQDVVVFIVGGVTLEEAKSVAQINASTPGLRVVLGGTGVLNSAMFLEVSYPAWGDVGSGRVLIGYSKLMMLWGRGRWRRGRRRRNGWLRGGEGVVGFKGVYRCGCG